MSTNEKYILRKIGLKFCKLAFYMHFVIKFEPFCAVEKLWGANEAILEDLIVAE